MKEFKVYGLKFIRKLLETKRKIIWSVFLSLLYTCTHTLPGFSEISLSPSFPTPLPLLDEHLQSLQVSALGLPSESHPWPWAGLGLFLCSLMSSAVLNLCSLSIAVLTNYLPQM